MHAQRNNKNGNGYKFKLTETTNHSIFMNDTEVREASSNPQDLKPDDPTNILDFSENKSQSKRGGKQNKKKKVG